MTEHLAARLVKQGWKRWWFIATLVGSSRCRKRLANRQFPVPGFPSPGVGSAITDPLLWRSVAGMGYLPHSRHCGV